MRAQHLVALVVALACAVFPGAACLQQEPGAPPEAEASAQRASGPEPIGEAQQEGRHTYESKEFPFVVLLDDDGADEGGGWQVARATLPFGERNGFIPVYLWNCRLVIGMPLRTERRGSISASAAALYTATVMNEVVDPLLDRRASWRNQGAVFCIELKNVTKRMFGIKYPGLGATVNLNQ